jgi:endoglucanase
VCVTGIGCSYDVAVDAETTWMRTTVQVARAMFQQRSGVALDAANTTVTRPRPFNPADGTMVVHQSTLSLLDAGGPSGGNRYEQLATASTDQVVPEAWGGHFDAGDWDRHIDHLLYLRAAIDLVELYPEQYAHLNLDIPESGDKIPDLIDEGLWDLDLFKRLQQPDGGIRGGIEEAADAPERASSWSDYQAVWVYAPDPRSSYVYAGLAAQAAKVLATYDAERSKGYADSATRAFAWAENHRREGPADAAQSVSEQRLVALAALYRLTGESRYQDAFVADGPFTGGTVDLLACNEAAVCDAGWIYARTDRPDLNADVHRNVLESFRKNADALVELAATTAYGWGLEHPYVPLVWGLGPATPKITGLMRAWALFHDDRYRKTAIRAAAFSLGGNPLDTVMVTGMGANPARNPLIVDVNNGGLPVWPGTPLYGMHQLSGGDYWVTQYFLQPAGTTPPGVEVPYLWEWFDLANAAMFTEFTVYQSHAVALFGFGSLAAAGAQPQG